MVCALPSRRVSTRRPERPEEQGPTGTVVDS